MDDGEMFNILMRFCISAIHAPFFSVMTLSENYHPLAEYATRGVG